MKMKLRQKPYLQVMRILSKPTKQDSGQIFGLSGKISACFRKGARFSKAPERIRARKAIFRSPVSKNGEVYMPETSCMKVTFLHL